MNTHLRRPRALASGLAVLLAAALSLSGCGDNGKTGNEAAVRSDGSVDLSKVTLVVGDQKGGSTALLKAAGLDDTPYEIETKEFTSGPPLLEALNAGAIHVGGVGNTPPLFAAAAGGRFKVVQAASYGGTGDTILVPKGSPITSVDQLKGKKVAVAEGSSANYNLLAQLQSAGLRYSDVSVQNLQPADALAAFTSGHVDAWAIWEPYTSQAEQSADAKVIATGKGLTNGYSFQVASDAALADPATTAALKDYLGRIAQAQVWSATHQEEWSQEWAAETGLDPAVTLAAVHDRVVTTVPVDDQVVSSEQEMADTFSDNGLFPKKIDVSGFFTDQFNADTADTAGAGATAGRS